MKRNLWYDLINRLSITILRNDFTKQIYGTSSTVLVECWRQRNFNYNQLQQLFFIRNKIKLLNHVVICNILFEITLVSSIPNLFSSIHVIKIPKPNERFSKNHLLSSFRSRQWCNKVGDMKRIILNFNFGYLKIIQNWRNLICSINDVERN